MITAPFNFVPLSEKVFFPEWSEWVSHDIPFKDGESGEIEITITAESPIFVRDHDDEHRFCNFKGQYYIPGSSIKGMLRNVLEIMSFGKMRPGDHEGNMDDVRFAVRDLSDANNFYFSEVRGAKAGWLEKSGDGYRIVSCGTPGRIGLEEIDRFFNVPFKNHFVKGNFDEQDDENKTAKYKYELLKELIEEKKKNEEKNKVVNIDDIHGFIYERTDKKREIYRFANSVTAGEKKGRLVMTGQPSGREELEDSKAKGKNYEFIFFEPGNNPEIIEVPKKKFDEFKFIYFDGRTTQPKESLDWAYWKDKLYNGERIPVFYHSNGKRLKHFGLAYLYKLPYEHTTGDGVPFEHKSKRRDLAETIFGYVEDRDALKGRVHISHARAVSGARESGEVSLILGTPRASYYPLYLWQNGQVYATYQNDHFRLAGWKRYPVHRKIEQSDTNNDDEVVTHFHPLAAGVTFKGKIRYHNLKPEEIGALLSALTFHGCDSCRHSIGLAKAFGYGKVKIELNVENIERYLKAFELMMSREIEDWNDSKQIRELLTMATVQNNRGNSTLKYMRLDPGNRIDDFRDAKKNKEYLEYYSKLDGVQAVEAKRFSSDEEKQDYIERLRQEKERAKRLAEEAQQRRKEEVETVSNPIEQSLRKIIDDAESSKKVKDPNTLRSLYETLQKKFAEIDKDIEALYEQFYEKPAYELFLNEAMRELAENKRSVQDEFSRLKNRIEYAEKNMKSEGSPDKRMVSFDDVLDSDKAKTMHNRLKSYMKDNKQLDERQLAELKEASLSLYSKIKPKEKKKFFKEVQFGRLLGKEFEEDLRKALD